MTYDVKIEKLISQNPADVFRAIGEGRLFLNCSSSSETIKMDFKVGGKYHLDFVGHGMSNGGEFLEIVPNKKIVFTWCQKPEGQNYTPDTTVTIELKDQSGQTHLTLTHSGFKNQDLQKDHEGGWTGGLKDLSEEMSDGRVRMARLIGVPVNKLYEACKNPATFFGLMGDLSKGSVDFKVGGTYQLPTKKNEIRGKFLEIVPNEKIVFTWEAGCGGPIAADSKVTLIFESEDEEESWLTLVHEGLTSEGAQKSHREGWDYVIGRLGK